MSAINSVSDEQRLKIENQAVNPINRLLKKIKQRFTLDNLRLGERYVKGDRRITEPCIKI